MEIPLKVCRQELALAGTLGEGAGDLGSPESVPSFVTLHFDQLAPKLLDLRNQRRYISFQELNTSRYLSVARSSRALTLTLSTYESMHFSFADRHGRQSFGKPADPA